MAPRYCEVALPVPLRSTFTYAVPESFNGEPLVGRRVVVPFRKRAMIGVGLAESDRAPEIARVKEVARKAKYQGTVVLWVEVGPDGRPRQIRVQRTLGMGLDEKAMEAVRTWKFEPARLNGLPVAVQINVEVNFRLY